MQPRYSSITCRDGRQLDYLQAGPADGPVLLFQHGTPGAATDFTAVTGPAATAGFRTVCYSRPGYGDSTPQPGRSVVDAVSDVEDLLDHLGVTRFRALGWSGGGPHALACAALLPERCEAVATLAGVAPYGAHGLEFTAGMAESNVEEFGKAVAGEAELDGFLTPLVGEFQQITADTVVEGMADLASDVDRQAMTGALAEDIAVSFRRALASGIAGWRDDDLAFVRDWGFLPGKIAVPVAIWQGRQDRMVPFEHGQWLAAEIPNAQPHLFEDEGHISLIARIADLLADLITL